MNDVRRGLGRGLSALLGDVPAAPAASADGIRLLAITRIAPNPDQPRRHFDEEALDELAASLRERGLIQPVVVRPKGDGFEIIAGERRWRAAQRAQLHEIPALVRMIDDRTTLELAIIENVQRQDLNALEEADAYRRLMDDYGHNQEALGRIVGKSRSHVANLLRLLDLPQEVQAMIVDGRLTMGHARALVTAADPATLAEEVVRRRLSVREAEALAKSEKGGGRRRGRIEYKGSNTDTDALERQLGDFLGLRVSIVHGPTGGSISVAYQTLDQLDMLCQRLSGGAA